MPNPIDRRSDVIVMGGGPVGLTLALALARQGATCRIVDPMPREAMVAPHSDGRASALSSTSWQMLDNLGLAATLKPKACAIAGISVCEALKPGALDFHAAQNPGDNPADAMGAMLANHDLRLALLAAIDANRDIDVQFGQAVEHVAIADDGAFVTLGDGATFGAALLIGADGRGSPTRERAGIAMAQWRYRQAGITATIAHERDHGHVAYQIFYPAGPLAVLPLNDDEQGRHRSSIVWTVPQDRENAYTALSDRAFAAELAAHMGGFLGDVETLSPRVGFPLGYHAAASMVAPRVALVGDAAHGIHPIAGQGLNLGLRDAAALAEIIGEAIRLGLDPADAVMLGRYESWRAFDNLGMGVATDLLNRLFAIPGASASKLRRLGMSAVQRTGLARQFFVDEARGTSGELPKLLQPAA